MRAILITHRKRRLPFDPRHPALEVCRVATPAEARIRAAEAVSAGIGRVLVAGGDGSIQKLLPVLAGTGASLGILPCGTGNDLAASLGIPRELHLALEIALGETTRTVDLLEVRSGSHRDLAAVGVAMGAAVRVQGRLDALRRSHPTSIRWLGRWAFVLTALAEAAAPHPSRLDLRWGDQSWEGEMLGVLLFARERFGGGFPQPRLGWAGDGRMKGAILHNRKGLISRLSSVARVRRGRFEPEDVRVFRSARVEIRSEAPVQLLLDGEYRKRWNPVVGVLPGALQVAVPADGSGAFLG